MGWFIFKYDRRDNSCSLHKILSDTIHVILYLVKLIQLLEYHTHLFCLCFGDGPGAYICERWWFASRLLTDTWQPSILGFLGTADREMGEWESAKRMFRWQVVIASTQRYCAVEVGSPFGREIVFSSGQFGNWSHTIDGGNQWCSRAPKILAGGGGSSIAAASDWTTSWSHVSKFSSAPGSSAHLLPQNDCLFDVANLCLLFSRGRLLYISLWYICPVGWSTSTFFLL